MKVSKFFINYVKEQKIIKILKNAVLNSIANPDSKKSIRHAITEEYIGKVDGLCSNRIVDYLIKNK